MESGTSPLLRHETTTRQGWCYLLRGSKDFQTTPARDMELKHAEQPKLDLGLVQANHARWFASHRSPMVWTNRFNHSTVIISIILTNEKLWKKIEMKQLRSWSLWFASKKSENHATIQRISRTPIFNVHILIWECLTTILLILQSFFAPEMKCNRKEQLTNYLL